MIRSLLTLLALLLTAPALAQDDPDGRTILARATEAHGGELWAQVRTLELHGRAVFWGKSGAAPIVALLEQISDLEPDKVAAIARTLDQASLFNDVVREQVAGITVGQRYEEITKAFNTIRDDAKSLVDQYADGKISTMERVSTAWMKMTRGDIASRLARSRTCTLKCRARPRTRSTGNGRSSKPI